MVNNLSEATRSPRLNPFVFPSDTDFYFVLLLVAVLASTLFIYDTLANYFQPQQLTATINCVSRYRLPAGQPVTKQSLADLLTTGSNGIIQCRLSFLRMQLTWSMSGVSLVLVVAGAIYLTIPTWKLKREKLIPIRAEELPEVAAYLTMLCQEAQLGRYPLFVWNPLNSTSSGLAFGRFGRYYVVLSGGLIKQFYIDRPAFRAIVLHELAHLRNTDVNKTYFAVAIWWAFIVVALVPFTIYILTALTLSSQSWLFTLNLVCRVLALTAFVYLSYAAVLRTREIYADMRASVWDGSSGALARALGTLPHVERSWQTVLRFHPQPSKRRQVLDETDHLFQMSLWQAAGVGIGIGVALANVEGLLQTLFGSVDTWATFFPAYLAEYLGTACIFAPLMVGVVGLGVWRSTFSDMLHSRLPKATSLVGLCLGLGVVLGSFLSLSLENIGSINLLASFIGDLPWLFLLLVSLPLFFWWIAIAASAWLGITATSKSPRLIYIVGLTVASVVLVGWLTLLLQLRFLSEIFFQSPLNSFSALNTFVYLSLIYVVDAALQYHLTLIALIALWAFPLASLLWRKPTSTITVSNWAFLDTPSQPITLVRQNSSGLRFAVVFGLLGGLIFCAVMLTIRICLYLSFSQAFEDNILIRVALIYSHYAVAALFQTGIATITASRIRYMGVLYGLFAAFVGGCAMTVATLSLSLLFGGSLDLNILWINLCYIIGGGALLALPTALCVSALIAWSNPISFQQQTFPARFAIMIGLLSGLAFCDLAFVMSVYLSQVIDTLYMLGFIAHEDIGLLVSPSTLLSIQTLLAVLFQAVTAAIVAACVKRWRVLQGLFAASLGGCLMVGGVLGAFFFLGGTGFNVVSPIFWLVVGKGVLLALPTALLVAVWVDWPRQGVSPLT